MKTKKIALTAMCIALAMILSVVSAFSDTAKEA